MAVFDIFDPLNASTPRLSEVHLNQINDWFDEHAKPQLIINEGDPINVITIEKLMMFLELKKFHRRSFHYPSYAEIMSEAEKLKAGVTRMLTKEQFVYMLDKWVLEPALKHELILAFKIFDTEKRNFLDIEEIQAIVTEYADVFNEHETREMLRDANVRGDGNVFYEDFVESMFSIAPELYEIQAAYLYDDPDEDPSVPPEPVIVVEEPPPPTPIASPAQPTPKGKNKGKGKSKK